MITLEEFVLNVFFNFNISEYKERHPSKGHPAKRKLKDYSILRRSSDMMPTPKAYIDYKSMIMTKVYWFSLESD